MKKLISFTALFLGITLFSIAQKSNITFHIKSQDGKIILQEKEFYRVTFLISGLNTKTETEAFKNKFSSNSIVKQLEIFPANNEQGKPKALLILKSKDRDSLINLLKSVNVTTLNVDNKDYTLDQLDQLNIDLAAKNQKKNQESKQLRKSK